MFDEIFKKEIKQHLFNLVKIVKFNSARPPKLIRKRNFDHCFVEAKPLNESKIQERIGNELRQALRLATKKSKPQNITVIRFDYNVHYGDLSISFSTRPVVNNSDLRRDPTIPEICSLLGNDLFGRSTYSSRKQFDSIIRNVVKKAKREKWLNQSPNKVHVIYYIHDAADIKLIDILPAGR